MSPVLSLDDAVRQIIDAVSDPPTAVRHPYFLIAGAGVSSPSIPLASAITTHCQERSRASRGVPDPTTVDPAAVYSYWFGQAYSQRVDRQRYLQGLIANAPVTHATFRLAHLLDAACLGGLLVTPNFDDFVSRALNLFGAYHVVCDHPEGTARVEPLEMEMLRQHPQIVHVHGSHRFYDCCNLEAEIRMRASGQTRSRSGMANFLDQVLTHRVPLVVGYSGWESDVIMQALFRRLVNGLPRNLYWFCYQQSNIDSLPEWLKLHPDVRFVIPKEDLDEQRALEQLAAQELREDGQAAPVSIEVRVAEARLSAVQVFDALIQEFKVDPPGITVDPLGFLVSHIKNAVPRDDTSDAHGQLYYFGRILHRIARARELELADRVEVEQQIDAVRNAVRAAQYRNAFELARAYPTSQWDAAHCAELVSILADALDGLEGLSQRIAHADYLLSLSKSARVSPANHTLCNRIEAQAQEVLNASVQQREREAQWAESYARLHDPAALQEMAQVEPLKLVVCVDGARRAWEVREGDETGRVLAADEVSPSLERLAKDVLQRFQGKSVSTKITMLGSPTDIEQLAVVWWETPEEYRHLIPHIWKRNISARRLQTALRRIEEMRISGEGQFIAERTTPELRDQRGLMIRTAAKTFGLAACDDSTANDDIDISGNEDGES